jgi:hypothetical protein
MATIEVAACANCGAVLQGPFCAQCGQHVADYHRSVIRLVQDFLGSVINWDNRIFATIGPLLVRPGWLTCEFMAGRRVRYVHPLRLFLFVSAVCLALLNGLHAEKNFHVTTDAQSSEVSPEARQAIAAAQKSEAERKDEGEKFGDSFKAAVKKRVATEGADRFSSEVFAGVMHRISWVLLAMLPIYALLLKSLYWRKDGYYFAHLIFSLHYHVFLLLFWTAFSWIAPWLPDLLDGLLLLTPAVYLFKALRRVYGGSVRRTLAKLALIEVLHFSALTVGLAAVGAASLWAATR